MVFIRPFTFARLRAPGSGEKALPRWKVSGAQTAGMQRSADAPRRRGAEPSGADAAATHASSFRGNAYSRPVTMQLAYDLARAEKKRRPHIERIPEAADAANSPPERLWRGQDARAGAGKRARGK